MRFGLQTWGSEGDVQPFLALAAGLVAAGHAVRLVVADNEGRDYSGYARRFGFELLNIAPPHPERVTNEAFARVIQAGNPVRQARLIMEYGFDPLTDEMYAAARELCETCDAVVGHFFLFPLAIAAEKRNVPLASLYVVHNCIPSRDIAPPGVPMPGAWAHGLGWKLVRAGINRIFLPRVNALRRREGVPLQSDVMLESWPSRRLNLVAVSPTIVGEPVDWAPEFRVCGFLSLPSSAEGPYERDTRLDEFLSAGTPPVYFTFGSMMIQSAEYMEDVARTWSDAVGRLGCRAVFQLPHRDLELFATGPQVFKVQRSDYRSVFPRCAAVVHHGGAGTTQSTLRAGRPSVVVAHMADQFFWGAELERLGVAGRTIKRPDLDAARLVKSLRQVLSSEAVARAAAGLAAALSREDGTRVAVALLERDLAPAHGDGGTHTAGAAIPLR